VVQVLQDQEDRPLLPCPLEQSLDRLADPRAPALRCDRLAPGVRDLTGEPRRDARQQPRERLGAGADGPLQLALAHGGEPGREALDDRSVRGPALCRHGGAAHHLERLAEPPDPPDRLADEPAHADAAPAGDEQPRAPPLGGGLQRDGEMRQLPLAPHETLAAESGGHGAHRATPTRRSDAPCARMSRRRHGNIRTLSHGYASAANDESDRRVTSPSPAPATPGPQPALWRDRNFLALWSASTVSLFGSLITRTALPFAAIYALDAGPAEISALRSAELVAALIVGLVAGAWVDRLRRRPIMIWADIGRAVLLASIPIAFLASSLVFPHLLLVAFSAALLTTFFDVADNAYLPTIVPRERLVAANSALNATGSGAELMSFGLGGFLIEILTAPIAVAIDAVTFIVSALLLGTIRKPEPPPNPVADREPVLREIRDGMRIVAQSPVLRAMALSHGGTHILWGIFGTVYLLFATEELGLGPAAIGVIAGLGGLGSFIGAGLAPYLTRRIGIGRTILIGILGFTIGNAVVPFAPAGAVVVGAAFLAFQQVFGDLFATTYEITETSLVQASVGDRVLGRVNATVSTFTTLLTLAGAVGGGIIGEVWGLRAAFAVGLVGSVAALLVVWFSPVRHIRDAPILPTVGLPAEDIPLTE
jgi:MFS family permease